MRLDIVRVTKTFRGNVRALEEVSLTVPGGILGLLGAHGAGKTTLMRLLTGLIQPNGGRITIGGHDMATADGRLAVQRVLGYLPQDLGVYPDLTARQFLDYVALLRGSTTGHTGAAGSASCWSWSTSPTPPTASFAGTQAACAVVSASRRRCSTTPSS